GDPGYARPGEPDICRCQIPSSSRISLPPEKSNTGHYTTYSGENKAFFRFFAIDISEKVARHFWQIPPLHLKKHCIIIKIVTL
ncbi:MAG: hypothetical protein IJS55_02895, partial [Oscillospiraceae bacterium]|nr:hypothetical protein [Oscillospiraceae bacterium]